MRTQAIRTAAVDTNAIEGVFTTDRGFTKSVATQATGWEAAMERKGEVARRAFADSLAGFELALDAATKRYPMTEKLIRDLHSTLLASQETYEVWTSVGVQERFLPKGTYKDYENAPSLPDGSVHLYAPVAETAPEMHRLVEELNSDEFQSAHPVLQASYAHYAFVAVHPFSDGNGRVSRALASMFLYRHPGIPFVVFDDQKNGYFDALEAADHGRYEVFTRFVAARAIDTISVLTLQLADTAPPIAESLAALGAGIHLGPDNEQLKFAALRLKVLAVSELQNSLAEFGVPEHIETHIYERGAMSAALPDGFQGMGGEWLITATLKTFHPREALVVCPIGVGVRAEAAGQRGYRSDLVISDGSGFEAEFSIGDLEPAETQSARQRMRVWVEGFWNRKFAELVAQAGNPPA